MERYIVIGIFIIAFAVLFIMSRKWKSLYLSKFPLLPGEKLLFEDTDCRIECKVGPGRDILPGSRVRVTDRRIIIAQKTLGRDTYIIRYVIHYTGMAPPEGIGGGALKTGYVTYRTISQEMSIEQGPEPAVRILPYGDAGMGVPEWLLIKTKEIGRYTGIVQG